MGVCFFFFFFKVDGVTREFFPVYKLKVSRKSFDMEHDEYFLISVFCELERTVIFSTSFFI